MGQTTGKNKTGAYRHVSRQICSRFFVSTHNFGDQGGSLFFSCAARLETHERDFSGVCGSVVEGSATRFKVPQLRRHIRFCKRGCAVHAISLSARRTTNWGLTGEQHDTNLTNWGKQPQSIAFNKALELLMLGWQGEGCFSKTLPRRCKRAPRRSKTAPRCSFGLNSLQYYSILCYMSLVGSV